MAFIVEQFTGDKGIQLGNEEIVRPFSFGTNWTTVRLGIRMAINVYSGLSSVDFRMGLCTGSAASYTSATDAVWVSLWGTGSNLTYTGTPAYLTQVVNTAVFGYQRVGTSNTNFNSINMQNEVCSANPSALRSIWMIDFVKGTVGSASMTVTQYARRSDTGSPTTDTTRATFLQFMENSGTPSPLTAWTINATLPTRFLKDWDSMFVAWPRSTPSLCVYDMTVVRYA